MVEWYSVKDSAFTKLIEIDLDPDHIHESNQNQEQKLFQCHLRVGDKIVLGNFLCGYEGMWDSRNAVDHNVLNWSHQSEDVLNYVL